MADVPSLTTADKSKPYIPKSMVTGAYSNEDEATASCFCGAVQMAFPLKAPGYVGSFICNCVDCHKITASMFASNFVTLESHTKHLRGKELLTVFGPQTETPFRKGNSMSNHFCSKCGTLMYRIGSAWPGQLIMRIGTVDDFNLMETVLRPQQELFIKDRVDWLHGFDGDSKGVKQLQRMVD